MDDLKFKSGVTLEWQQEGSRVGFIRVHRNPDQIPGPTTHSLAVECYKDGTFEFKIFKKDNEEATIDVRKVILRPISLYLHGLGYKGKWSRHKDKFSKDVEVRENYYANINEDSKE